MNDPLRETPSRRLFLRNSLVNLGSLALAGLLDAEGTADSTAAERGFLAPRAPHFEPAAKNVILLFMAGGPSQIDLFDSKPVLTARHGEKLPASVQGGFQFPNLTADPRLLRPQWDFQRKGRCGAEFSELLPALGEVADDLTIVKSMVTENVNHGPATTFFATGSMLANRPSIGSWVTYGLGSESKNLPAFVVLQSARPSPVNGRSLWSSGFLPAHFSGVPFRSAGAPIMYLENPPGVSADRQKRVVAAIAQLDAELRGQADDPAIDSRIHAYEMTSRLQLSAPELTNLADESAATLTSYGATPNQPSFAANCLLARRLVERGVRFVQLVHWGWDQHFNLQEALPRQCQAIDQASAALIQDLKQRGLLEQTLVVWGGEFGRTPMGETSRSTKPGRDHHKEAFTIWLAGGGIKPGLTLGKTDDFGFNVVEDPVHIHDLQATILHQLGLDHEKLTYRFQGREFRLTDVGGDVVTKLLA